MELERPVQEWIVLIATNLAGGAAEPVAHVEHKLPGEIGMKALIVMQRFIAQSPETQHRAEQKDRDEGQPVEQLLARRFPQTARRSLDFGWFGNHFVEVFTHHAQRMGGRRPVQVNRLVNFNRIRVHRLCRRHLGRRYILQFVLIDTRQRTISRVYALSPFGFIAFQCTPAFHMGAR